MLGGKWISQVADTVIENNLNYRSIFYQPLPAGVFTGRPLTALNKAREFCSVIQGWLKCDTIGQRKEDIAGILRDIFGDVEAETWRSYADGLPAGMTLEELRDYLWADTDEQQSALHEAVLTRLSLSIPAEGVLSPRVRIMTMHGAKGLSGKIVFIPGLEEAILPGPKRSPYPGLGLEAARLLYMSITRAKAACIISYADRPPIVVPPTVLVQPPPEAWGEGRRVSGVSGRPDRAGSLPEPGAGSPESYEDGWCCTRAATVR